MPVYAILSMTAAVDGFESGAVALHRRPRRPGLQRAPLLAEGGYLAQRKIGQSLRRTRYVEQAGIGVDVLTPESKHGKVEAGVPQPIPFAARRTTKAGWRPGRR